MIFLNKKKNFKYKLKMYTPRQLEIRQMIVKAKNTKKMGFSYSKMKINLITKKWDILVCKTKIKILIIILIL